MSKFTEMLGQTWREAKTENSKLSLSDLIWMIVFGFLTYVCFTHYLTVALLVGPNTATFITIASPIGFVLSLAMYLKELRDS